MGLAVTSFLITVTVRARVSTIGNGRERYMKGSKVTDTYRKGQHAE